MTKCIIIGAHGFIGKHLVDRFIRCDELTCVPLGRRDCDLLNSEEVKRVIGAHSKGAFVVFAAGIQRQRGDNFNVMQLNLTIIQNLIDALEIYTPAKMIFLGTVEVYGNPRQLPITEITPIRPETLYGIGKHTAELMLQRWAHRANVPLAIIRMPGIYGPGDMGGPGKKGRGFIGYYASCCRDNRQFCLFGDGRERRDYVHVSDVCALVERLCKMDFVDVVINVVTGKSLSLKQLMAIISSRFGVCRIEQKDRDGPVVHLDFDNSCIKKVFGPYTFVSVEAGVASYLE